MASFNVTTIGQAKAFVSKLKYPTPLVPDANFQLGLALAHSGIHFKIDNLSLRNMGQNKFVDYAKDFPDISFLFCKIVESVDPRPTQDLLIKRSYDLKTSLENYKKWQPTDIRGFLFDQKVFETCGKWMGNKLSDRTEKECFCRVFGLAKEKDLNSILQITKELVNKLETPRLHQKQESLADDLDNSSIFEQQALALLNQRPEKTFIHKSNTGKERVVIAGSGLIGLANAYLLSKEGYQVTILEKEKELCSGSSDRNIGAYRAMYFDRENTLFYWNSIELLKKVIREIDKNNEVTFYDKGYLYVTGNDTTVKQFKSTEELHNQIREKDGIGIISTFIDQSELLEMRERLLRGNLTPDNPLAEKLFAQPAIEYFNQLKKSFFRDDLAAGLYSNTNCGFFDVRKAVSLLIDYLKHQDNVEFINEAELVDVKADSQSPAQAKEVIIKRKGESGVESLEADSVILAVGPYASRVSRIFGANNLPLTYELHEALVTEGNPFFLNIKPLLVDFDLGWFVRTKFEDKGKLIMCQGAPSDRGRTAAINGLATNVNDPRFFEDISTKFFDLLPGLSGFPINILRAWWGFYQVTEDGHPLVDCLPGWGNVYAAAGFCGHGIMGGFGVAKRIVDLITGRKSDFPTDFLNIDPNKRIRPSTSNAKQW